MNQDYEKLQMYLDKQAALGAALTLLEWDNETLAPEKAMDNTARCVGILSEELYRCLVNEEVPGLLKKLGQAEDLTEIQAAVVRVLSKELAKIERISAKEQREFSELLSKSGMMWQKAKAEDDFALFAPYLEQVVAAIRKHNRYQLEGDNGDGTGSLYDVSLNEYEEGFGRKELDTFFAELKETIVPLLGRIQSSQKKMDTDFMHRKYDVEKQKQFNRWLAEYLGFDFSKGVMGESEHPFTTNLHNRDVRITTHYYEDNLISGIFSTIHETGHALYEMNVPDELTLTPVGGGASCGMHESQSRMLENMIGRSREFWEPVFGKLQETFPEQLCDVDLEQFVQAVNCVVPDLIRTESDELTYCLHIMVRYEAEKKLIEEEYPVSELPKLWNELYQEYLGVTPDSDKDGVLQDVHWSGGMFGYFPSYALGNAFAAQLYNKMKQEMDVPQLLRSGQIGQIINWLKEHVHCYGAAKPAGEILKLATGEEFCPAYYVQYLKEKYTKLYELN